MTACSESVQAIFSHAEEALRRLSKAEHELNLLISSNPSYTIEIFEKQWGRQREMQTNVISETAKQKRGQISLLLGVEEQLFEAR